MIEYILVLGVGIWAGYRFAAVYQQMVFKKILDDLGVSDKQLEDLARKNGIDIPEILVEEPQQQVCEIVLEQHGDQIYAYRKADDHFLGQGTDRTQLLDRLKAEFTGEVKLIIREEDGANLIKNG